MEKIETIFVLGRQLNSIIPSEYIEDIQNSRVLLATYRGRKWDYENEDTKLRGLALFVCHASQKDCYELRYIYLSEDIRYQGNVKLFLSAAEKVLTKKNPVTFVSYFPEDSVNKKLLALYNRYGFKEYGTEIKVGYSLADMVDTDFGYRIHTNLLKTNSISKISSLTIDQLTAFKKMLENEGKHFDIKDIDCEYSRFFVYNDKILGFSDLIETEPNILLLKSIYVNNTEATKYAVPLLLSDMLATVEEKMTDEAIFVCQNKDSFIDYLTSFFGKPLINQSYTVYRR